MKIRGFEKSLPRYVHEILMAIGSLASEMGYSAYLAGGIVRDILLGRKNLDIDVAIEGDAIRFGKEFALRTGSIFKGATRFGTCKVHSKAFGTIDLSSTRKETYSRPGVLPEVQPANIIEDLGRRDFTINAMAVSLAPSSYGHLIDPFGGLKDLRRGVLRVLHERSFMDDPTRILRGVRIGARYSFRFESKTRMYLKQAVDMGCLSTISGPRIFDELKLICSEEDPRRAILLLKRLRVIEFLFGGQARVEARDLNSLRHSLEVITKWTGPGEVSTWIVWFAYFFRNLRRNKAQELIGYFNLPSEARTTCEEMSNLQRISKFLVSKKDRYLLTVKLESMPLELLVHIYASMRQSRRIIKKFLVDWRHVRPILRGSEIAAMGVREGAQIGEILREIRRLKLRGKVLTREDEIEFVKKRLSGQKTLAREEGRC